MNENNIAIGKKYRHFKGNEYLVLYIAKHSETLEDMVVYQALYGERGVWVRPLSMFIEKKEVDGKMISRFEEIKTELEILEEICNLIRKHIGSIPFKSRGIVITKELIEATLKILNSEPTKAMPQNSRNATRANTPEGLDRSIKDVLDFDLRTANIISDVLQYVGVVQVANVINPTTGRKVKGTKLLPEWQW